MLILQINYAEHEWYHYEFVKTIEHSQNMQYEVDPKSQTWEDGKTGQNHQKTTFCTMASLLLNDPHAKNWWHHYHIMKTTYLAQSKYVIWSRSNGPNSRKWPKPSFLTLWIIQKCIFVTFEWSSMSDMIAKFLRPFSIITICNMKSIRCTKLEKLTQNWMCHSKILRVARQKF